MKQPVQTFSDWLEESLPQYERLANVGVSLLTSMLKKKGIEYLSIEGRPKSFASATEKAKRKGYSKPKEQMTDLAGIRVVTFLEEQVRQVVSVIEELFEVDRANSMNRAESLGHDRMGYRSTHFVCVLGERRNALPEYEALGDLKFEIQLRTVLQHAWAELAHDRSFKFKTILPVNLQRKLNLYSGLLEVVDGGFDQIAIEIDKYQSSIQSAPAEELSQAEIDSISIEKFLSATEQKYNFHIRRMTADGLSTAVEELRLFGISNIGQLEILLDPAFIRSHKEFVKNETDIGFLRSLMMFSNIEKYLGVWSSKRWSAIGQDDVEFLASKYGMKRVLKLLKDCEIEIESQEDEDEDFSED
jgi:putative GTP pyrophosphokinase